MGSGRTRLTVGAGWGARLTGDVDSCGGVPAGVDTVNGPPRPVVEAEEDGSKSLSSKERKEKLANCFNTCVPNPDLDPEVSGPPESRSEIIGKDLDLDPDLYINMQN